MANETRGAFVIAEHWIRVHPEQKIDAQSADEWAPFGRLSERYEKGLTGWWARQDSNLRQHRYERRVLTN